MFQFGSYDEDIVTSYSGYTAAGGITIGESGNVIISGNTKGSLFGLNLKSVSQTFMVEILDRATEIPQVYEGPFPADYLDALERLRNGGGEGGDGGMKTGWKVILGLFIPILAIVLGYLLFRYGVSRTEQKYANMGKEGNDNDLGLELVEERGFGGVFVGGNSVQTRDMPNDAEQFQIDSEVEEVEDVAVVQEEVQEEVQEVQEVHEVAKEEFTVDNPFEGGEQ